MHVSLEIEGNQSGSLICLQCRLRTGQTITPQTVTLELPEEFRCANTLEAFFENVNPVEGNFQAISGNLLKTLFSTFSGNF